MELLDYKRTDLYINRELSLLAFNRRVLDQARDPAAPVLERLRFLCISSSNLDEFFEIRVAGLKQRTGLEATQPIGPEGITPQELLRAISTEARASIDLRLVPDQKPERVRRLVEEHIRKQGFFVVDSEPGADVRAADADDRPPGPVPAR